MKLQTAELAGENILSLTTKGVTLTFPEVGIEKIFLSSEELEIDKGNRRVSAKIGANWNYTYKSESTQETKKSHTKFLKGKKFIELLKQETPLFSLEIERKFQKFEKSEKYAEHKNLVYELNLLAKHGIRSREDFYQRKVDSANNIKTLAQTIQKTENNVEKFMESACYLMVIREFQPIARQIESVGKRKNSLIKKYASEWGQYSRAKEFLEVNGISAQVIPEKLNESIQENSKLVQRLVRQLENFKKILKALK